MIRFDRISKKLGGVQILNQLSFELPEAKTLALLGLSGSGKTTLLKLACGLLRPDSGEIKIAQTILNSETLRSSRAMMGYVVQDGGLFPHLTAYENLAIIGEEVGQTKLQIRTRISELAKLTKISEQVLLRYPREISGGQKQRISVMRALYLDPPILLLDEPFGALDPITRSQLQSELKDIFKQMRKTVLLVTHDLHEAGFLADHIILLNQGEIAQSGTMAELVKSPKNEFVKLFVNAQRPLSLEY